MMTIDARTLTRLLCVAIGQTWRVVAPAAIAGLASLWLGAQPAHAQDNAPATRPARPFVAPQGRPWIELPPAWPALPQGAPGNKPDRYAPAGPSAPLAGIFTVNSADDTNLPDAMLTLREALMVANGSLIGPFTLAEQAQLWGCSFNGLGEITGGCGANIQDTILFASALGFRPVITLADPLPAINDAQPTLLLGAFFNNVQPVINAQNLPSGQAGLQVNSDGNTIAAISVISAPANGINIVGNLNTVGYWTMARNNAGSGIHIAGLTNTVEGAYIGVFSNTVTHAFDCAGNSSDGIRLGNTSRATTIRKNVIGCNGGSGVRAHMSSNNLIGGAAYITDGNLIAWNIWEGIYLAGGERNVIQANAIGFNRTGVLIEFSRHNTITAGINPISDTNAIVMNTDDGIRFESGAQENMVANSQIYWNGRHGVNLVDTGTATNTLTRTLIYANAGDGIRQSTDAGPNLWREMAIAANGGLGIDVTTADHVSDIPHPPYFIITSVNPATGLVQGKANESWPGVSTWVDLYRIALDPSGYGEGYEFVGSAMTNLAGNWSITDPNPSASGGCYTAVVRMMADAMPSASEFTHTNCNTYAPIVRKP